MILGFTYTSANPSNSPGYRNLITFEEGRVLNREVSYQDAILSVDRMKPIASNVNFYVNSERGIGFHIEAVELPVSATLDDYGYFEVYVAGHVRSNGDETDLYIAKFNTRTNVTEWYFTSDISGVNETVLATAQNDNLFYVVVSVNTASYLNATHPDITAKGLS